MINLINFLVLFSSSLLMLYFYVKSASPTSLAKKIGDKEKAYRMCGRYRMLAGIFELIIIANYIMYAFYPLPLPLPATFPWDWGISALLAVIIAVPSGTVMMKGVLDAGKEAWVPQVDQGLYKGIYGYIRHPQAFGELFLWWSLSLLLNSPFLALYSLIFIPIFVTMVVVEEKDLLIRFGSAYDNYRKNTGMFLPKWKKK